MATDEPSKDVEVLECEQASCSTTPNITTASSSTFEGATPGSPVPTTSAVTEEEEEEDEDEELPESAYWGTVLMDQEFEELDINDGWQQAHLEVADQCFEYPCLVARAPENRYRNRHRYVSPYDHSRVRLKAAFRSPGGDFHPGLDLALSVVGDSFSFSSVSFRGAGGGGDRGSRFGGGRQKGWVADAHNDYINASLVVMQVAQRKYILTQGPLPNTCGHFWLMVWQQNSRGVVMLNKLVERSSIKCSQYWPPHLGQSLLFEEMSISVHLEGEDVRAYYKIHHLRLENMVTGEKKPISHFQFTQWPDLGVPESPIPFLAFLSVVRDSGCLSHEQGPVVIHCTSGIGRSGVFALVDACLVMMESKEHPFSLNIRQVLVNMRKYRMGLIQTPEQLRFSYMAVIRGAKQLKKNEQQKK